MKETWRYAINPRTWKVSDTIMVSSSGKVAKRVFQDGSWHMTVIEPSVAMGYFQIGTPDTEEDKGGVFVHRLIFFTFHPEYLRQASDRTFVVDHIDGDKTNNSINNLRLVKQAFNSTRGKKSDFDVTTEPHLRRIF